MAYEAMKHIYAKFSCSSELWKVNVAQLDLLLRGRRLQTALTLVEDLTAGKYFGHCVPFLCTFLRYVLYEQLLGAVHWSSIHRCWTLSIWSSFYWIFCNMIIMFVSGGSSVAQQQKSTLRFQLRLKLEASLTVVSLTDLVVTLQTSGQSSLSLELLRPYCCLVEVTFHALRCCY